MIQVFEVLGKDFESIKDHLFRTDFKQEDLELLSKIGGVPPISEAKFIDDLYLFNFKIDKYKIEFFNNAIGCLKFATLKRKTIEIVDNLIKLDNFKHQCFTKKQIDEAKWNVLNDTAESGFIEFKTKHLKFDESSKFDIKNINHYSLITLRSDNLNIIITEEIVDENELFVFEFLPNIN